MLVWCAKDFTHLLLTRCWACVVYLLRLRRLAPIQQDVASVSKAHRATSVIGTIFTEHEEAMGYTIKHGDRNQQLLTPKAGSRRQ